MKEHFGHTRATVKREAVVKPMKHKHAFVGVDADGIACIYVMYVDQDGTTGDYFDTATLQKIADRINRMHK